MEVLSEKLGQIKVPTANDNIYSEECVFSYDTPVKLRVFMKLRKFDSFVWVF